jgi:phage virion morphogenesis protein
MSGVRIEVTTQGLDAVMERLAGLSDLNRAVLLDQLGGLVETQTKKRIADEKRSPDGKPWKPNIAGSSILFREGYLLGSVHHISDANEVRIGSGLIYAAIHQFGGTILPKKAKRLVFTLKGKTVFATRVTMPARPYLGVSAENAREIERSIIGYLGRALA